MLGKKLKDLRKKHSLKQSDLAAIIGVTRSQVATYETERGKPSFDVLVKMADYFKVPLDYFYDSDEAKFIQTLDLTEDEIKNRVNFVLAGEKLTDDEIRSMIDYVRFLRFNKDKT